MTENLKWIHDRMCELAKYHPLFHSESYFQHELAGLLYRQGYRVQTEESLPIKGKKKRFDIWLPDKCVAIELKYRTHELETTLRTYQGPEPYLLRPQSAQNIGRYEFLKDVWKLEQVHHERGGRIIGYAILLTNDEKYWDSTPKPWQCPPEFWEKCSSKNAECISSCSHKDAECVSSCSHKDAEFHLHPDRVINGDLDWKHGHNKGAAKTRPKIPLSGRYTVNWKPYLDPNLHLDPKLSNGTFQYLAFQVPSPES